MTSLEIELVATGPLFDGTAGAIVDAWLEESATEVMRDGLAEIGLQMDIYFRDPTPYYETQVVVDRVGSDWVLHDRGVIYGPWLDGSGSRNSTSRFRGYPHWRRTVQYLQEERIPEWATRGLQVLIGRLGG